ncbi:MAG: acyl-CoA/acyl-ACP dehydrogenase [Candidatus Nanopelagicales bacterium]|nr:acyl-CoA/acyl-ACP dehydrogenase [Candidatus Nanopelagicales bacterium]
MKTSTTTAAERSEFRSSVRDFLSSASPETRVREVIAGGTGLDEAAWKGLSADLGITGLLIPEEFGGQGMGMAEMVVALEEAARALAVVPLLSSGVLAPLAIQLAGDAQANATYLPGLADGSSIMTLAGIDGGGVTTQARDENGWSLYGTKTAVLNAQIASQILVTATTPTGTGLFVVDAKGLGVVITPQDALDLTRPTALVTLEGAPAVRIGGEYSEAFGTLVSLGRIATSAELLGMSEKLMEVAVDYAKTRVQFGKPIGAFQAIKHRCSEMFAHVESMRAAVETAALVDPSDTVALHEQALVVKAYCSRFAPWIAEATIQVHGGIGFTWEHCAHLYLRRVKTDEVLFGNALVCRDELQQLLGLTA